MEKEGKQHRVSDPKNNKRASGPKENNEIRKKLTIFANTFVKRNTQNTP